MKAIRSLCAISLLLAAAGSLAAQDNPWKDGDNITGIRVGKAPARQSSALLFGKVEEGGFRPAYEASSYWKTGIRANTEVHEGKLSMAGSFAFSQKEGKDMMRSMFVHPGLYPFDLIEFTPGPKTLQTYTFDGGAAWEFSPRWTLGGKVLFEADNYSKRKDLRHTNYYQDITVLPALKYRFGPDESIHVGLNGCYRSKSESVKGEQLGASGETYEAFLDKGMMYGTRQVWDGDGVHLTSLGVDRFPVREQTWGAAVQASVAEDVYGEFSYTRSSGEVGEKGYVWMRFPGEQVVARLTYRNADREHFTDIVRLELKSNLQYLDEFVVDRQNEGGVMTPVSYTDDPKELSRRHTRGVTFRYDLYGKGSLKWLPHLQASVNRTWITEKATPVYPYTDSLGVDIYTCAVSADFLAGRFLLGIGLNYMGGKADQPGLRSIDPAVPEEKPYRLEGDWVRRMEYMTADRLGTTLSVRYPFSLGSVKGLFVGAEASWIQGFGVELLPGSNRKSATLQCGIKF